MTWTKEEHDAVKREVDRGGHLDNDEAQRALAEIERGWAEIERLKDPVDGLEAKLVERTAEREEARDWVRRLTREQRVLTCAFCGAGYPPGTPESNDAALTAHVRVCPRHPMREAEAEIERLTVELAIARAQVDRAENDAMHAQDELAARAPADATELQEIREWHAMIDKVGPPKDATACHRQRGDLLAMVDRLNIELANHPPLSSGLSLRARGLAAQAAFLGALGPNPSTSIPPAAWIAVVRAVDASRPPTIFVPTQEQAQHSPLLSALHARGETERAVIDHLFAEVERLRLQLIKLSEHSANPLKILRDDFSAPETLASRPGLTEAEAQSIAIEAWQCADTTDDGIATIRKALLRRMGERPTLTEEQMRAVVRRILANERGTWEDMFTRGLLKEGLSYASRGETGPAPTWGEQAIAEHHRAAEDVQRDLIPHWHRRMPDLTIACNNQRPNEGATDSPDRVTCPDCIVAQEQIAEEKRP